MGAQRKLTTEAPLVLSQEEFDEGSEGFAGVCPDCAQLQWGEFEPDARGRRCDTEGCGGRRAMGLEWAVVAGLVVTTEQDEST